VKRSCIFVLGLLVFFNANRAFAQQTAAHSSDSHKYRKILTIAGAAGGFSTGFLVGRAAYDTPNSGGKVWTAAAISSAVAGGGGYLIGWAIDGRRNPDPKRSTLGSDKFNVIPLVSRDTKGMQFSLRL
jgi:hypothetical protein